jgi:hypothetical protein
LTVQGIAVRLPPSLPSSAAILGEFDGTVKAAEGDTRTGTGNSADDKTGTGLILVTPTGDWVSEGSREFLAMLGDPDPDYDAALFAVRNLGFIAVRRHEAMLDVILHPRNAEPGAVDAVVAMLGSSTARLSRITYLTDRWRHETITTARDSAARIVELCPPRG